MPLSSLPLVPGAAVATAAQLLWTPSLRIAALAWSCSAWAKISFLDRRMSWAAPAHLTDRERRRLSAYHLLVAIFIMRVVKPALSSQRVSVARHGWRAALLLALAVVLDEYVQWAMVRRFEHARTRFVCVGRPAPLDKTDDDCFVCQGVGLGDWQPRSSHARHTHTAAATAATGAPHADTINTPAHVFATENVESMPEEKTANSKQMPVAPVRVTTAYATAYDGAELDAERRHSHLHGKPQLQKDDDVGGCEHAQCGLAGNDDDDDDRLESFCMVSDHVAHRACMRAWWLSQHYRQVAGGQAQAREIDPMVASMTRQRDASATVFGGVRRVPHPPTHTTRCPCCRRRLKFAVRLSRNDPTEVLLNGRVSVLSWAKLYVRSVQWRDNARSFVRHLFSADTLKRSGVTAGFGLATFLLGMIGAASADAPISIGASAVHALTTSANTRAFRYY
ncbi:hypothetical protein THASP1DRAFT_31555 [Thamnocephalis sphaerospora]|uniref:Uncharacterized protein n=1 Tax=Thamnocephalis sphaerospora TaxID=78915 RepID=A0A4P9XLA4_9FUNG|nr:hypothetical protein THASP1DRAFT_31555 [Thamnocephalis sphaerospora]|eukprot:RKP06638.1 hypothetical protein THASP1DRAFT_31555 [Thamnocephalis sphaerospora]